MHYKMGNVNWKLFKLLIIPAIIGAVLGAYILSSLEHYSAYVKPIVAIYTLFLGGVILMKAFNIKRKKADQKIKKWWQEKLESIRSTPKFTNEQRRQTDGRMRLCPSPGEGRLSFLPHGR